MMACSIPSSILRPFPPPHSRSYPAPKDCPRLPYTSLSICTYCHIYPCPQDLEKKTFSSSEYCMWHPLGFIGNFLHVSLSPLYTNIQRPGVSISYLLVPRGTHRQPYFTYHTRCLTLQHLSPPPPPLLDLRSREKTDRNRGASGFRLEPKQCFASVQD